MLELTDATFEQETCKDRLTLVDFWAPWCGPCNMLAPIFEEVSSGPLGEHITFAKLNIDSNSTSAAQHGVRSIPFLVLFKNGKMVDSKAGLLSKDALVQWIQLHVDNTQTLSCSAQSCTPQ